MTVQQLLLKFKHAQGADIFYFAGQFYRRSGGRIVAGLFADGVVFAFYPADHFNCFGLAAELAGSFYRFFGGYFFGGHFAHF